ncbi:hypothetical protein HW090_10030 [Pseudomonas sp. ABC1]|uniref:hypothetical protein n=1 Tax=Pseudomonas sp. ABC1 TaxID=2748080 RepID=UPI0015C3DF11|nr:hypothetical protein [Pseudomonas sp. ABC1]QLF93516.1 hypothetical protein HW090_10030 [Pseudomonas sp. ABC1]
MVDDERFAKAAELLLAVTGEPEEPAHLQELIDWVKADVRNKAAFEELERVWQVTGDVLQREPGLAHEDTVR